MALFQPTSEPNNSAIVAHNVQTSSLNGPISPAPLPAVIGGLVSNKNHHPFGQLCRYVNCTLRLF